MTRLRGTTPADPGDTGAPDPALAAALATGDGARVAVALLRARLLVPVVAMPGAGEAEMAVPALVDAGGRRALPVFSGVGALAAWRADARPVPMPGARAVAGAAAEGYDAVVLDVAGPQPQSFEAADLATLAAAAQALLANPGADIAFAPDPESPT